jgi:sulfate transport system substrate-binding protein
VQSRDLIVASQITSRRIVSEILGLSLGLGILSGCSSQSNQTAAIVGRDVLRIGAYSVVREVVHDGLLHEFAKRWKERTGRDVTFEESYNASGTQARQIATGLDSDIAILSHEGDMALLVKAGRVPESWNAGPTHGIITRSVVVIGHRDGNPKSIRNWADLARPGVGVLYPDPKTSGGARWNINAIYGAALLHPPNGGKAPDTDAAREQLARVQANVVNMDPSGRQSVANFERGMGDALVTYENELLLRKKAGKAIPYVVPEATLLIEGPAAIVETSVKRHGNQELATAFLDFLNGPEGQKILAEYGFRPVAENLPGVAAEPLPAHVFRMSDLGGWAAVEKSLYGPDGVWTRAVASSGATTP